MISQVEQNYYKDIRRIAKALEGIEKHLSTIAKTYAVEPMWFDPEENAGCKAPVDAAMIVDGE